MVRKWVGGGLKPLGEMLEREEETHEGERAAVLREIFMRSTREVRPPPLSSPLTCQGGPPIPGCLVAIIGA